MGCTSIKQHIFFGYTKLFHWFIFLYAGIIVMLLGWIFRRIARHKQATDVATMAAAAAAAEKAKEAKTQ